MDSDWERRDSLRVMRGVLLWAFWSAVVWIFLLYCLAVGQGWWPAVPWKGN